MNFVNVFDDGHILHIQINRPDKFNALTPAMYHTMGAALARLNHDPQLRVAVLYAEGKHFTAGVELDLFAPIFGSGNAFPVGPDEVDPFGLTGPRHNKPIVMAAQGYCFTWGLEIMLNTEIRVVSRDTQFQMLEVQRGLYPCGGATLRLPKEVGWANAQRVLLTGDRWGAEEAYRWGMVQDVVEPGEQLPKALEYARKIVDCAPLGVQGLLKSTRTALAEDHDSAVRQMFADLVPVMRSEDAAEGLRSFVERRKAIFRGK